MTDPSDPSDRNPLHILWIVADWAVLIIGTAIVTRIAWEWVSALWIER